MEIKNQIDKIVGSFTQLPYLFIGTGMSIRYSTAPTWNKLLYEIWSIVNESEDESKYKKFIRSIEFNLGINDKLSDEQKKYLLNPEVASRIQTEFNKKFYEDDLFEKKVFSKEESLEILEKGYDPFKMYIAKITKNLKLESDNKNFYEVNSLKKHQNKIAGVITTNYDLILEEIFSDFSIMVGQDNMLTSNISNLFEIFKIHGSTSEPSSIVITKDDYEYFENKLKYLSAKLLTLFVEHPIIFIGYSISDYNIREIIKEMAECLTSDDIERLKNNFIFLTQSEDGEESIKCKEIDFGDKRIKMTEIYLNDYSKLYEALSNIKSSMPIKLIRKMQDMVCNFVATTKPTKNIMVGNIDSPNLKDEEIGIYIGKLDTVAEMGFDYYGIEDIIEDILFDSNPNLMNKKLIEKTFKNIRSVAGKTYLPVYKYLRGLNMKRSNLPKEWHILDSIDSFKLTNMDSRYSKTDYNFKSLNEIELKFSEHIPRQLAYIQKEIKNIDKEELGDFLRRSFRNENMKSYSSTLKKLVAIYDLLMYK
ncbi:SIR2 family protein [Clostridium perfringens]|nr:SIR2 family protein [Clostridium perfringens]